MSQPIGPLMVSLRGTVVEQSELDLITHPAVGGCILFARNYRDQEQLRALLMQIKDLRPELLLAVDHEGGPVQRLRGNGFTSLPAAATLGRYYNSNSEAALQLAYSVGRSAGQELRDLGFDTGFSPVLDLSQADSTVLKERTLHHQPEAVIALGNALCSGLQASHILAVGKHFPGHGSVAGDTHTDSVSCRLDWQSLQMRDLQPFAQLIAKQKLDGIMTAHVIYEKIDAGLPATLSAHFLQTVLREQLGFAGIVFSDDLSMHSVAKYERVAHKALVAGCDMPLICHNHRLIEASLNDLSMAEIERYSARLQQRLRHVRSANSMSAAE